MIARLLLKALFILGVLTRVFLYTYRIVYEPHRVVNQKIVESNINKIIFISHLFYSLFASVILLSWALYRDSWLGFLLIDISIWVSGLIIVLMGMNQASDTYGRIFSAIVTGRNILELLFHIFLFWITSDPYLGISGRASILGLIVTLWTNRMTDTYLKFYVFRSNEAWNILGFVTLYLITFIYGMIGYGVLTDGLSVVLLLMIGIHTFVNEWTERSWRNLNFLKPVFRFVQRLGLQRSGVKPTPVSTPSVFLLAELEQEVTDMNNAGVPPSNYRTISGYHNYDDNKLNGSIGQFIGWNFDTGNVKAILGPNITLEELYIMNNGGVTPNPNHEPTPARLSQELFSRDETKFTEYSDRLKELHRDPGVNVPNAFFSYWTQFVTDDWVSSDMQAPVITPKTGGGYDVGNVHEFKVNPSDTTISSIALKDADPLIENGLRYYKNKSCHWWCLTTVYGRTYQDALKLRVDDASNVITGKGCNLILDSNQEFLKVIPDPISIKTFMTGVTENMNLGKGMLHFIFASQHNHICDQLSTRYPDMGVEKIYHTARLINIANHIKIHTLEWTNTLVQTDTGYASMYSFIHGLLGRGIGETLRTRNVFSNKPKFLPNSLIGSMGGSLDREVNFAHTQEFVAVYRMHSLVPTTITVPAVTGDVLLGVDSQAFDKIDKIFIDHPSIKPFNVAWGMGNTVSGTMDLLNTPELLRKISTGVFTVDLPAGDIFRARSRGVVNYNYFRQALGMQRYESLEAMIQECKERIHDLTYLTSDDYDDILIKLKDMYDDDIDKLDFAVGVMLEPKRPGYAIPDSVYNLFTFQTQRRIEQDAFLNQKMDQSNYTEWGLRYVADTTFAMILKSVFPEIADQLDDDDNAFCLWDNNTNKIKTWNPISTIWESS